MSYAKWQAPTVARLARRPAPCCTGTVPLRCIDFCEACRSCGGQDEAKRRAEQEAAPMLDKPQGDRGAFERLTKVQDRLVRCSDPHSITHEDQVRSQMLMSLMPDMPKGSCRQLFAGRGLLVPPGAQAENARKSFHHWLALRTGEPRRSLLRCRLGPLIEEGHSEMTTLRSLSG